MFGFNKGSWQDSWSHHRSPYLHIALIVVAVHLLMFVFAPPFHFKPYRLEAQEVMVIEEIPDFELPPPVQKEPVMPAVIEPWIGPIDDDPSVPRNVINDFRNVVTPREPSHGVSKFVPFDKPPVPRHLVMPTYPEMARETGIEGIVMVKVRINIKGKVIAASILNSEVTDSMNQAALAAAYQCTFKPAKQRNKPVPVTIAIPFEFRLNKN